MLFWNCHIAHSNKKPRFLQGWEIQSSKLKIQNRFALFVIQLHRRKGSSVYCTGAVFFQHLQVELGTIPFMPVKSVHRISGMITEHEPVSGYLGNNGGSGAQGNLLIPLYHGLLGDSGLNFCNSINDYNI